MKEITLRISIDVRIDNIRTVYLYTKIKDTSSFNTIDEALIKTVSDYVNEHNNHFRVGRICKFSTYNEKSGRCNSGFLKGNIKRLDMHKYIVRYHNQKNGCMMGAR